MASVSLPENASLESLVARVVDEFHDRRQGGERPTVEEYTARYPEAAELLGKVLAALDMLSLSVTGEQARAPEPGEQPPGTLGDFRIIREVGRGGMGIVYEAEQISLGRRVALKVLPLAATMDPRHLQRFKNEAQAAAHLQHQNIVPVYFVGVERGVHFYAMQFIDGHSLAEVIDQLGWERGREGHDPQATQAYSPTPPAPVVDADSTPLPAGTEVIKAERTQKASSTGTPLSRLSRRAYFAWVARLGEQAALALEHAHQQGVLHRDIKPANLMLDSRGDVWITDFGLAQLPGDQRLTMTGDLLGTLRYMSPEQALAQRVTIDQRTDVYSLGVTLYELLTLEPAYAGHDRQALLNQIAFKEPRPPRKLDKAIPAELETIVLKAMEKVPGDRYSAAQELAEDLHRYLADQPIRARRPGVLQRLRKWGRRHKPVVTAVTVLLLLALIGSSVGSWLLWRANQRTEQARDRANQQWSRAEQNLDCAYAILDQIYMDVAEKHLPHHPRLTSQDRQLLDYMRTFYEKVAEQDTDTPATRLRTAKTLCRIGDIQQMLGQEKQALDAYNAAIRRLVELPANDAESLECRVELAHAYHGKGCCHANAAHSNLAEYPDAIAAFGAAAQLYQQIALTGSRRAANIERAWAECELRLASAHLKVERADDAIPRLRHAESLLNRIPIEDRNLSTTFLLAWCQQLYALALAPSAEQDQKYRLAIQLFEKLRVAAPDELDVLMHLWNLRLARCMSQTLYHGPDTERKANRQALDELTRLTTAQLQKRAKDQPRVYSVRQNLIFIHSTLARLLQAEHRWLEAERQDQLGLDLARKLEADFPDTPFARHEASILINNLAWLYCEMATCASRRRGDMAKAVACAQEAVGREPDVPAFQETLGESYYRAGQYRASLRPLLAAVALMLKNRGICLEPWLVLSMAHSRLGNKAAAFCSYRLAVECLGYQRDSATSRLRDEAAALLDIPKKPQAVDDRDFAHQLKEMFRNAPQQMPSDVDAHGTPVDRLEQVCYAETLNNLAWAYATAPNVSGHDRQRAVRLAQYAVQVMPREGSYINTLGVAQYRTGAWQDALKSLRRSMELRKGGDSFDWFFLSMSHCQLGQRDKARDWYARAVEWMATNKPQDAELILFRSEAAKLLGMPTG